jgi:hypothetical protein
MTQEFVKRVTLASISLNLIGGLFGCQNLAQSVGVNVNTISEVKAKSAIDTTVTLGGKVQNRAPFLGMGAYQLKDNTGQILVLTKKSIPPLGKEVVIKGVIRSQKIMLKELPGKDLGEVYIEEQEILTEDTAKPSP